MTLCLLQTPRDPGDPCSNQGRLNSGISKIEVSRICADLDSEVAAFRDRSLAGQSFPYVFLDATYCKARVNRRVISQAVVVGDSEDGAFWTAFLRSLNARGFTGCSWSSPTPTWGCAMPSKRCWPARPCNAAACAFCATCWPGSPRARPRPPPGSRQW